MLHWFLWSPFALAGEPEVRTAWYLWETGRVEESLSYAAGQLHADPTDVGMHVAWAFAQVKGARGRDPMLALYGAWAEASPLDPLPALMKAKVLLWTAPHDMGPWCEEVAPLLETLPEDPLAAYYAVGARMDLHATCPGDPEADEAALLALDLPYAARRQLSVRMGRPAVVDAPMGQEIVDHLADQPWTVGKFYGLFADGATGDGLEAARAAVRATAEAHAASDDPVLVLATTNAFRHLGDSAAQRAAEAHLAALDPEADELVLRNSGDGRWAPRETWSQAAWWEMIRADRRAPRRAVSALSKLDTRIPEEGPLRAAWLGYLADNYDRSMRGNTALEHWRDAAEAAPGDPRHAFAWAIGAADRGRDMEEALANVDAALVPPIWDPRHDGPAEDASGWDDWRADRAEWQASLFEARAWLLQAMDRPDEASAALRQALLHKEHADLHLKLGQLYAEQGHDEAALHHLGRGLAHPDGSDDRSFVRRSRAQARRLFDRLTWGPDFDLWIAAQAPQQDRAPPEEEATTDSTQAYRVGQTFPDLEVQLEGRTTQLSDIDGVKVIDLWATWCGPCRASIPVLDDAAKHFSDRGVTVLVVSVDEDRDKYEAYGKFGSHHQVAWAGPEAMAQAKVKGIPATFVIDADGVVQAYHSGYRPGGDDRLREALEKVLAAQ